MLSIHGNWNNSFKNKLHSKDISGVVSGGEVAVCECVHLYKGGLA